MPAPIGAGKRLKERVEMGGFEPPSRRFAQEYATSLFGYWLSCPSTEPTR